jgi:hypothetical protein
MPAAADVEIAALALRLLGENGIAAFADSPAGQIAGDLYPHVRNTVLTSYPWSCTKRVRQLARLAAAPDAQWAYAHQLPSGHLRLLGAWPSAAQGASQIADYDVTGGDLLSASPDVWLHYQFAAPETSWPPYLRALATYALAAELAMPITDQTGKAEYWTRRAWGSPSEAGKGGWYRIAAQADAQGAPPQAIAGFELVDVRF